MNPRVVSVHYQNPYKPILTFANKEIKEFDFSNYLNYPVYQPLKEDAFCSKVHVFNGTAVWDENIDFDPDTLYLDSRSIA